MADYRPDPRAAWLAAVRPEAVLLVPAARAADLVDLWPSLSAPDAAARVLDRLIAGGVTAAPGFALAVREPDSVRVLVRGPIEVLVGTEVVSGAGVSTWTERAFAGADDIRVLVDGATAPSTDAAVLPLPVESGVVAAVEVVWRSGTRPAPGASATTAAAARATVQAPVPSQAPVEQTMVPDEDTVVGFSRTRRPRFDTAVRDAAEASADAATIVPPPRVSAAAALGDHDGLTVAASDIRRLRESREPSEGAGPASTRDDDRLALRMPDGSFEPLGGELVLGRAPVIGRVSGTRMPRAVVIGAGDPDISRTHLRIGVEGGTAVVTDLESRNGTHVVAPGQAPRRLRPAEATPVLPETVIDLGGGWTVQVVVR